MERSNSKIPILILSDGKRGHLKQSLAIASLLEEAPPQIVPIHYKFRIARYLLTLATWFPFEKKGSTLLLKYFLTKETSDSILKSDAKIIISAGHGISAANLFACELLSAKSVVIMTPAGGKQYRYALRIIPAHDLPKPLPNTITTLAAPTFLPSSLLEQETEKLASSLRLSSRKVMSLFIGGDSHPYRLSLEGIALLIKRIKQLCEVEKIDLFITTSRRTPEKVEMAIKEAFSTYPHCKLLILWRENQRDCIAGMVGLSEWLLVTEDSISMISEAVNSGKKVIVLKMNSQGKRKHERFIQTLEERGYIRIATPDELEEEGGDIFRGEHQLRCRERSSRLDDQTKIQEALRRLV